MQYGKVLTHVASLLQRPINFYVFQTKPCAASETIFINFRLSNNCTSEFFLYFVYLAVSIPYDFSRRITFSNATLKCNFFFGPSLGLVLVLAQSLSVRLLRYFRKLIIYFVLQKHIAQQKQTMGSTYAAVFLYSPVFRKGI